MNYKEILEIAANIAGVLTFIGVVAAWCYYQWGFYRKRKALEKYLEKESIEAPKRDKNLEGTHTVRHLTAELGLTESEILQASFKSKKIIRKVYPDKDGIATEIYFGHKKDSN